jgi:hypothetical protein
MLPSGLLECSEVLTNELNVRVELLGATLLAGAFEADAAAVASAVRALFDGLLATLLSWREYCALTLVTGCPEEPCVSLWLFNC